MSLPQEILQTIFSIVSGPRGLYPLLTVSHTWSSVAIHELYLNPLLDNSNTWNAFSQLFTSRSIKGNEIGSSLSFTASYATHLFLSVISTKQRGDAVAGILSQAIDFGFGTILRFRPSTLDKL